MKWLKRLRGALGMGITWAFAWALGGVAIGVTSLLTPWLPWERFFDFYDAPLPTLAMPGFIAGTLFSLVLSVAGRRERFHELSLVRFASWGAVGGLLLSFVPALLTLLGSTSLHDIWVVTAIIAVPFTAFSAVSAAGSLVLARRAEAGRLGGMDADVEWLLAKDTRELVPGRR